MTDDRNRVKKGYKQSIRYPSAEEDERLFERALRTIVEYLNGTGISVILTAPSLSQGSTPPHAFTMAKRTARTTPARGHREEVEKRTEVRLL